MTALRQAVAAGFADLDRLEKEPRWLSLRARTDFKALVTKLRETASRSTSTEKARIDQPASTASPGGLPAAGPVTSAQAQQNQSAARHAIGLALLNLGKLDDAAEYLKQALAVRRQIVASDPARHESRLDLAATLVGLAEIDRRAGRAERAREWWGQALPMLTQAIESRPADRLAWQLLGLTHAGLNHPEQAARAFARLMEVLPQTSYKGLWWYPDPATIGELLAPYDGIFARVVQLRPRDRTLLIARFHYLGRRRRWREAAEIVARLVQQDPDDNPDRLYDRILRYHCGDFRGYEQGLRRELELVGGPTPREGTPRESWVFWMPPGAGPLAVEAYRNGQYAAAVRYCKESIRTTGHSYFLTLTHLLLAMAHQQLGQSSEARKELEVGRGLVNRLGRGTGYHFASGAGELLDYGWTEWLHAGIVLDEAEALILYDPAFPAAPFAP